MKLVHPDLEAQIRLDVQHPSEWVIESQETFARYVQELCIQADGGEGRFVLSEEDEIEIPKYLEVIMNPLDVDFNDRKVLNRLYVKLNELANGEEMYLETQKIKGKLLDYFLKLEHISPYVLETDAEIDVVDILKAIGVKPQRYAADFVENLCQYIMTVSLLMKKKVFVIVNARSYISDEKLDSLMKTIEYNEIMLLLIENVQRKLPDGVRRYIIDSDECEIF